MLKTLMQKYVYIYLIEYNDIYSKTSRNLMEYYGDKPLLNNAGNIIDLSANIIININNNNDTLFKFKEKNPGQTGNDDTKDVEILVLLKYPSNFGGPMKYL